MKSDDFFLGLVLLPIIISAIVVFYQQILPYLVVIGIFAGLFAITIVLIVVFHLIFLKGAATIFNLFEKKEK